MIDSQHIRLEDNAYNSHMTTITILKSINSTIFYGGDVASQKQWLEVKQTKINEVYKKVIEESVSKSSVTLEKLPVQD